MCKKSRVGCHQICVCGLLAANLATLPQTEMDIKYEHVAQLVSDPDLDLLKLCPNCS